MRVRAHAFRALALALVATGCSGSASTTVTSTPTNTPANSLTTQSEIAATSTTAQDPADSSLPAASTTSVSGATGQQSIEVAIPAEGLDLAGTLRVPGGDAPAPAVDQAGTQNCGEGLGA